LRSRSTARVSSIASLITAATEVPRARSLDEALIALVVEQDLKAAVERHVYKLRI